jgi:hypothetical protein
MVCGLSDGGKWIRTIGTRKISHLFETDFCRLHDGPCSRKGFTSLASAQGFSVLRYATMSRRSSAFGILMTIFAP